MNPPRARAFGSLRSRNVRLFLGGQSVSLVGTWIQQVAMGWLAYRLTGSPLLLGVLAAAGQLPSLLLMPIAGGLRDRWSRHRILISSQSPAMGRTLVPADLATRRSPGPPARGGRPRRLGPDPPRRSSRG